MWQIFEARSLDKTIKRLPLEIIKRYEVWKDVVRTSGTEGLKRIKGFHDEKLVGIWSCCRSSRLGIKYRVIYEEKGSCFVIRVIAITPHDYRRAR